MKSFLAVVFAALVTTSCFAQSNLNLANGIPPQGSYGGSNVDTVNLLNGNVTLHIPLPVDVPQRGKLGIKYYLVVNAKSWSAAFDPTYQANQWSPSSVCTISTALPPTSGPCGQGPVFVSTASLGMTRGFVTTSTDGSPTDYVVTDPTSIDTWDGSGHGLLTTGPPGFTWRMTPAAIGFRSVETAAWEARHVTFSSLTAMARNTKGHSRIVKLTA